MQIVPYILYNTKLHFYFIYQHTNCNMKKIYALLVLIFVSLGCALALKGIQENAHSEALVEAPAGEVSWFTDFDEASAEAKSSGLPILLDFTGSDWCGWCIRLDKEVFSQPEFKAYASKSLVLVKLDFPRAGKQSNALKKQNEALSKKYEIRGFPTIVLVSPEGEEIERTGYQRGGAAEYVSHLKELLAGSE